MLEDGHYRVKFKTLSIAGEPQEIYIGTFVISHDYVTNVVGPQLERRLLVGPITPEMEWLIESGLNNGYYETERVPDPPTNDELLRHSR